MKKITAIVLLTFLLFAFSSCTRTVKTYYPSGHLQSVIQYKFGREDGKTTYFYDNPNTLEIVVEMKHGKRNGEFFRYFENGSLDTHCFYVNDSIEGIQTFYTANGEKTQEFTYKHGHRDGPYKAYHLNGDLNIEGNYENDLYDGDWRYYDERGVLVGEATFKEGTGDLVSYDARGVMYKKTHYVRNKKEGLEIEYASDGKIIKETLFKNDRIVSQKVDSSFVK